MTKTERRKEERDTFTQRDEKLILTNTTYLKQQH